MIFFSSSNKSQRERDIICSISEQPYSLSVMYQQRPPYYYSNRHHRSPVRIRRDRRRSSPKELLWRLAWPYVFTIVLASLMLLFILMIFALEIASLATDSSNNLSNTASTGAGIWCAIFFILPVICMYLQGKNPFFPSSKFRNQKEPFSLKSLSLNVRVFGQLIHSLHISFHSY